MVWFSVVWCGVMWPGASPAWALSHYSDLTLSQSFQPMAAQLSKKAALPLAKILATAPCRRSKTGPWFPRQNGTGRKL